MYKPQNSEQRNPIHAGRLHDHGLHAALGQPVEPDAIQVRREEPQILAPAAPPGRQESRRNGWWRPRRCTCRIQVYLGQLRGQTLPPPGRLARRPGPPVLRSSGVSSSSPPATSVSARRRRKSLIVATLPNGIAPIGTVTNDAAVRLPDHALSRAICAKAKRP